MALYALQCTLHTSWMSKTEYWFFLITDLQFIKNSCCAPSASSAPFWFKYLSSSSGYCCWLLRSSLFSFIFLLLLCGTGTHIQSLKGEGEAPARCPSPPPPSSWLLHPLLQRGPAMVSPSLSCPHHPQLHQSHPSSTSAKQGAGVACCVPAFTYRETCTSVYTVLEKTIHSTPRGCVCVCL